MKKLLFIVLCGLSASTQLNGQTVSSVLGGISFDPHYRVITIQNTKLFDAPELKARGIKRCYIIHPLRDSENKVYRTDSLYTFDFDSTGHIERTVRLLPWGASNYDTTYGNPSERRYYTRIDTVVSRRDDLMTVTKYYIWPFDPETEVADTGKICKIVYDLKGRMLELKMDGTKDYHTINFCGNGTTFHDKYRYDKKGNISYYQDARWIKYATFSHRPHRRVVRVYDSLSHKLQTKYTVMVDHNSNAIVEKTDETTILTRMSKNSRLFSRFTQKRRWARPDEYFLIYEYFDKLPTPEKLLVKQ
jgi:hypothetical protein